MAKNSHHDETPRPPLISGWSKGWSPPSSCSRQLQCNPPASFLLKANEPFDPGKSSGKAAARALLLTRIQTALISSLNLFVDDLYPFGLVLCVLAFSSDGFFPCSGVYSLAGYTACPGSANLNNPSAPD